MSVRFPFLKSALDDGGAQGQGRPGGGVGCTDLLHHEEGKTTTTRLRSPATTAKMETLQPSYDRIESLDSVNKRQ